MTNELIKSLHTGYSRAKKSNSTHYIIPASNGYSISKHLFSILNIRIYYYIDPNGNIIKYDDGENFNIGSIDFLNVSAYI